MKNFFNFRVIIVIVWIITIIWICVKVDDGANRFSLLIMTIPVYGALISTSLHYKHENESRKNPINLSIKDSGKVFRVSELGDNIIGLTRWGYRDCGLRDIEDYQTFYFIGDIPIEFRQMDALFKVIKQRDKFVFQEIKVNGFSDKTKEPFEILPEPFYA